MKKIFISFAIFLCYSCQDRQPSETSANKDTTTIDIDDSTAINIEHSSANVTEDTVAYTSDSQYDIELIEERGELVYVNESEFWFLSDPYEFALNADDIFDLLYDGTTRSVNVQVRYEIDSSINDTRITYRDTEINFSSYSSNYDATITTPLLPLKKGIVVGMHRSDFTSAMGYEGNSAAKATVFRLLHESYVMEFSFRADTLYRVYAQFFEPGD